MDYFHMVKLEELLLSGEQTPGYADLSQKLTLQYKLEKIEELGDCRALILRINSRMRRAVAAGRAQRAGESYLRNWVLCEYKLFKTVLVLYSITHSIQIAEMTHEHLDSLAALFPHKERAIIDYEVASLAGRGAKSLAQWTQEENSLLSSILALAPQPPNWKEVAIDLYRLSQRQFFRQFTECREQWNNHLNPAVTKAQWTQQEDFRLVELIEEYGLKWSVISRAMGGVRNEHMVKNRYNSLLKKATQTSNGHRHAAAWQRELLQAIRTAALPAHQPARERREREAEVEKQDESLTELSEPNKPQQAKSEDQFSIDKYLDLNTAIY